MIEFGACMSEARYTTVLDCCCLVMEFHQCRPTNPLYNEKNAKGAKKHEKSARVPVAACDSANAHDGNRRKCGYSRRGGHVDQWGSGLPVANRQCNRKRNGEHGPAWSGYIG